MAGESPPDVSIPAGTVFLSYASQDAQAAQRICEALRTAGVEVWFDQSELRGGDAWDRQIRERIHDCRLFIAVVSAHTEVRDEGYFRREWRLAVERTQDMLERKTFLLPVVIDATSERGAAVPDKFREVQWTRLPAGETSPAFVEHVRRLVSPESSHGPTMVSRFGPQSVTPLTEDRLAASRFSKRMLLGIVAVLTSGALAYLAIDKFSASRHQPSASLSGAALSVPTSEPASAATVFAPPPHSIAVLPFVNLSGNSAQDYFSDGLTEELLNSLARIDALQVAGRTSSFYFKGEHADLTTIAHRLNVASVLEGSVRRSGNTVRITAQLINALTGFHTWSQTYDRDLRDVLNLQTEIANAVADALKVTLLGDLAGKIELRGTREPAAFDAYLRGAASQRSMVGAASMQAAIAQYSEAIRLDPGYALAYAGRAAMEVAYAKEFAKGVAIAQGMGAALADARRALTLAPELAEGHEALARWATASLEFARALQEYERAVSLAPGSSVLAGEYGRFAADVGLTQKGVAAARRAVLLDPLNPRSHYLLGVALYSARRYAEARWSFDASIRLNPDSPYARAVSGQNEYAQGNLQRARELCESGPSTTQWSDLCLALTYEKLGRRADAQALLAKYQSTMGDAAAYQYAEITAQWGDVRTAIKWLETALRLRDPGLVSLRTDALLDPLRNERPFQAIEQALKFPSD